MEMEFRLRIDVANEEEATKLQEAIYSEHFASLVKFLVLYGGNIAGGAFVPPAPPVRVREEDSIKLEKVAVEGAKSVEVPKEEPPAPKKPRGLRGRKMLGRVD